MGRKVIRPLQVEGYEIEISNPQKVLFPERQLTKWDYVMHLARLAPYLLLYSKDRLLTTIRYPDGVEGESFYQKNCPNQRPEYIHIKKIDDIEYILLNNTPTLIWLANLACLEFHVSFQMVDRDTPTELVFDLDPSTPDFGQVVETALYLHEVLETLGLASYPKTSGASGIQVYIPIESGYTFEQTRKVNHFIASYLQDRYPQLVTIERQVKNRGTKVYVDYLQHWYMKTLIAPYSPRAKAEATVSTPISWQELQFLTSPTKFNLTTIHGRLEKMGDLFSPMINGPKMKLDDILTFIENNWKQVKKT